MYVFHSSRPFRPLAVTVAGAAALLLGMMAAAGADPGTDNRAPELTGDTARLRVEEGN
jgi:hypothetical protein